MVHNSSENVCQNYKVHTDVYRLTKQTRHRVNGFPVAIMDVAIPSDGNQKNKDGEKFQRQGLKKELCKDVEREDGVVFPRGDWNTFNSKKFPVHFQDLQVRNHQTPSLLVQCASPVGESFQSFFL